MVPGAAVIHDLSAPDTMIIQFQSRTPELRRNARDPTLSRHDKEMIEEENKRFKLLQVCWKAIRGDSQPLLVALQGILSKPRGECTMEDLLPAYDTLRAFHHAAHLSGHVLRSVWLNDDESAEVAPAQSSDEAQADSAMKSTEPAHLTAPFDGAHQLRDSYRRGADVSRFKFWRSQFNASSVID
jgi:hypothetical protein